MTAARDAGCTTGAAEVHQHLSGDAGEHQYRTIPHMRELFGCEVGLSDHTHGIGVAVARSRWARRVIEKHFTLSRGRRRRRQRLLPGAGGDGAAGASRQNAPGEALGRSRLRPTEAERRHAVSSAARSTSSRPEGRRRAQPRQCARDPAGPRAATKHIDDVLGMVVKRDVKRGTALSWDLIGRNT